MCTFKLIFIFLLCVCMQLFAAFNNGNSKTTLNYNAPQSFCDNKFHTLYVVKDGKSISMAVNDGELLTAVSSGHYTSVDKTQPLTVGRRNGAHSVAAIAIIVYICTHYDLRLTMA